MKLKRHLLLERKVMINLDSILKSRDITLPTKVRLVKAMVLNILSSLVITLRLDIYIPVAIFLSVWGWFCRSFYFLVFLDYISPFHIYCKAGLVVLNSLNFCLSEKLFVSPSILNEILAGYSNLGCRFFPFSTLNISCHSLLAWKLSAGRSAVKHIGFPLYVTLLLPCCFYYFFFVFSVC